MQSSSLIFLVLIAIWAAYLLQHWVRRREHLATARSVDRFSDAMRVLERRSPLVEFDPSARRPRSYALSPARPSRPEEVLKPSRPEEAPKRARPPSPSVAAPATAVRSTRFFHLLAGLSARRVRGLTLLAALSLALVVSPLAAFSILPWWSAVVTAAALVADVAWLRHVAVSGRGDRRAPEARRPVPAPPHAGAEHSVESVARHEPRPAPGLKREDQTEEESESESESEKGVPAPAPFSAAADVCEQIEPPFEVDPSAWAPVPVPPPTYTLKARAADPVPAPAVVPELGASECWSLDGLVYDCDLDELVERCSATGA